MTKEPIEVFFSRLWVERNAKTAYRSFGGDTDSEPVKPKGEPTVSDEETMKKIRGLEEKLQAKNKECDAIKADNEQLLKQVQSDSVEKWVDWLDEAVFHSSIKPWEVFATFHGISTPNLTDNARCYVLFRVLDKIHWLKNNMHQKDIIKWVYAHSGITWQDSDKLRFGEFPDGIMKTDISQWRKASKRRGEYYASFAETLLSEFVYTESKGIQDKRKYIKDDCALINFIPR